MDTTYAKISIQSPIEGNKFVSYNNRKNRSTYHCTKYVIGKRQLIARWISIRLMTTGIYCPIKVADETGFF